MLRRQHASDEGVDAGRSPESGVAPTPAKAAFEGQVFGIQGGAVVGWVWNAESPYETLEVELYVDDIRVAQGKADHFDLELAKAKRGNGMHRFELRLDRLPAQSAPFQIRAVVAGTSMELLPAVAISTLEQAESLLSGSEYCGQITGISDGMIRGWAINRRNPHENPVLTLRDGPREIAVQPAIEQSVAAAEAGGMAGAFRFQFPVPANALDGRIHAFSVTAGQAAIALAGSPVLFGPTDTVSVGRTLVAIAERLDRLEARIESLRTEADVSQLERRLTSRIMDPLDMLLGVHRDSVEREMSVIRRQIVDLASRTPGVDPDVTVPVETAPAIEDVPVPVEAALNSVERSAPIMRYDLGIRTPMARPTGALRWLDSGEGIALRGDGGIELDGLAADDASFVLRGQGAKDAAEFGALLVKFNGRPLGGRFNVGAHGEWTFIGHVLDAQSEKSGAPGLGIQFLSDIQRPSGRLTLGEILVFGPGRAPSQVDPQPARSTIINLGKERAGMGWHPVEAGARGGICWMGESGEISLNLQAAGSYTVNIPEIRPLTADIMPKLQIFLDDVPVTTQIARRRGDAATFNVSGRCMTRNGGSRIQTLRLCFPKECVKSPLELGLNQDTRPLTVALRCVVLSALTP